MGRLGISVMEKLGILDNVQKNGCICEGSRSYSTAVIKTEPSRIQKWLKEEEKLKKSKIQSQAFSIDNGPTIENYN